jgi:hypothetical protein
MTFEYSPATLFCRGNSSTGAVCSDWYGYCLSRREGRSAVDKKGQPPIIGGSCRWSKVVNRLVSMLMLAAFATQHFMCCCSELGGHAFEQDHFAAPPVCVIASDEAKSVRSDKCCCHEHRESRDASQSQGEESPSHGSHGHHLCVASHVFFVTTPRAVLPPSMDCHDFGLWPAESSITATLASLMIEIHHGVDFRPPLTAQARRAALCVYRI